MYGFTVDKKHGIGNFTEKELRSFCIKAYKHFYYRPSYIAKQFIKAIKTQNFRILRTQMNYIQWFFIFLLKVNFSKKLVMLNKSFILN